MSKEQYIKKQKEIKAEIEKLKSKQHLTVEEEKELASLRLQLHLLDSLISRL